MVKFLILFSFSAWVGLDSVPDQVRHDDAEITGISVKSRCEGGVPGIRFQERRKQDVCAAAPMDGFTAVLKPYAWCSTATELGKS